MKLMRTLIISAALIFSVTSYAAEEKLLTIVHTNDMHSHIQGFSPELDYRPFTANEDNTVGGWSRIATIIKNTKEQRKNPVLVLDSGDYTIGSLFHALAREEAFELRLLHAMGYDAVGMGKHEFDLKPAGLARNLITAKAYEKIPQIVFASAVFNKYSKVDDTLEIMFGAMPVKKYMLVEKDGIKVGIFGIIGKKAASESYLARPVTFRDPVDIAGKIVRVLREEEKADVIICLSHSGLDVDPEKSEDEILARKVKGIDVIVSGCSHHLLKKPVVVENTIIVQAGAYGRYVGVLDLACAKEKTKLKNYRLVPVNSSIVGDKEIQKIIDDFKIKIDRQFLSGLDLSYDKVLAQTKWDLKIDNAESPLGNMIADSVRWYVNKIDSRSSDPRSHVVIGVESNGVIRDHLLAGKTGSITVADLFRTVPLGIGKDEGVIIGYPLVSFYLYAYEIKRILEILTSVHPRGGYDSFINISGVRFAYNPERIKFDRITNIEIGSEEEGYRPLDYSEANRKLYRVASSIYSAEFLRDIGNHTYRFLDISPKDRRGRTVRNLTYLRVDAKKFVPGTQEAKLWHGVVKYVQFFKDINEDGVPDVPEQYRGKRDRIVVKPSRHPADLISNPKLPTILAMVCVGFILGVIIYCLWRIKKRKKKRRSTLKFK